MFYTPEEHTAGELDDGARIRAVIDAIRPLVNLTERDPDILSEGICGENIPAPVFAQLLMDTMRRCEGRMDPDAKAYWAEIGSYMGPDWIAAFRKVGAFMHEMDRF